jgi:hypothetical protein
VTEQPKAAAASDQATRAGFARPRHDRLSAGGPWVPVTDQHGARAGLGQHVEGSQVAGAVDGRRASHDTRTATRRVRVQRDDGIAGDHGISVGEVQRAMAVGVAGREDDSGEPGTRRTPSLKRCTSATGGGHHARRRTNAATIGSARTWVAK